MPEHPPSPIATALADRYTVERELGRGGMATVYLAEEKKHGRKVAIKVLRPEITASVGTERFLREIGIAARLSHPHIVRSSTPAKPEDFSITCSPTFRADRCAIVWRRLASCRSRMRCGSRRRSAPASTSRTARDSCIAT